MSRHCIASHLSLLVSALHLELCCVCTLCIMYHYGGHLGYSQLIGLLYGLVSLFDPLRAGVQCTMYESIPNAQLTTRRRARSADGTIGAEDIKPVIHTSEDTSSSAVHMRYDKLRIPNNQNNKRLQITLWIHSRTLLHQGVYSRCEMRVKNVGAAARVHVPRLFCIRGHGCAPHAAGDV